MKDAVDELKQNLPQVVTNGNKCAAKELTTPVDCYKLIYGPIRYTPEQRSEWEAKMKDKKGFLFKAADYPLDDQYTPEEIAAMKQV